MLSAPTACADASSVLSSNRSCALGTLPFISNRPPTTFNSLTLPTRSDCFGVLIILKPRSIPFIKLPSDISSLASISATPPSFLCSMRYGILPILTLVGLFFLSLLNTSTGKYSLVSITPSSINTLVILASISLASSLLCIPKISILGKLIACSSS